MVDTIFREYDIRGKVGSELLIEDGYALGRAIAYYLKKQAPSASAIALGMDGRTHSRALKDEIERGLRDSGFDVYFIGLGPTPMMYYSAYALPVDAGVMITASHNPKEYNGVKITLNKESVHGPQIREIRDIFRAGLHLVPDAPGRHFDEPLAERYCAYLASLFPQLKGNEISVLVDCGNGAAGAILPKLVDMMAWKKVKLLFPEVDGTYPHHEADPTVEENMESLRHELKSGRYDFGVGLDGDCDRMAAMTAQGNLLLGDFLLALFSVPMLEHHPASTVVADINASQVLLDVVKAHGGQTVLSPSGAANIKKRIKEYKALLGGELSCHLFFNDRYLGYDDGIYAMMRLFELVLRAGKSLQDLCATLPHKWSSPAIRIPVAEERKQEIVAMMLDKFKSRPDAQILTIDGMRVTLPYGWGLIRASNTQPMISMRFESDSEQGLQRVQKDFATALQGSIDTSLLRKPTGSKNL